MKRKGFLIQCNGKVIEVFLGTEVGANIRKDALKAEHITAYLWGKNIMREKEHRDGYNDSHNWNLVEVNVTDCRSYPTPTTA